MMVDLEQTESLKEPDLLHTDKFAKETSEQTKKRKRKITSSVFLPSEVVHN